MKKQHLTPAVLFIQGNDTLMTLPWPCIVLKDYQGDFDPDIYGSFDEYGNPHAEVYDQVENWMDLAEKQKHLDELIERSLRRVTEKWLADVQNSVSRYPFTEQIDLMVHLLEQRLNEHPRRREKLNYLVRYEEHSGITGEFAISSTTIEGAKRIADRRVGYPKYIWIYDADGHEVANKCSGFNWRTS